MNPRNALLQENVGWWVAAATIAKLLKPRLLSQRFWGRPESKPKMIFLSSDSNSVSQENINFLECLSLITMKTSTNKIFASLLRQDVYYT